MAAIIPQKNARAQVTLTARGIIAETVPYSVAGGGSITTTSQRVLAGLVGFRAGDVVTSLTVSIGSGAGTGVTLFKLGLYKADGTFLGGTADLTSSLAINSFLTGAISGGAVTIPTEAGYYLAVLSVFATTGVVIASPANLTPYGLTVGSGSRMAAQQLSQADLPSPTATFSAISTLPWLAAS